MCIGHGPDFKARTDLREREEKAKIEEQKKRQVPERLDHRHPDPRQIPNEEPPGLIQRLWRGFRG